jgi:hypothetical protein
MIKWSPESLGIREMQNCRLWQDMERAYSFIESHARYLISGDLEGFLFELIRAPWNLTCRDNFGPAPNPAGHYHTSPDDVLSLELPGLSSLSVRSLSLQQSSAQNKALTS